MVKHNLSELRRSTSLAKEAKGKPRDRLGQFRRYGRIAPASTVPPSRPSEYSLPTGRVDLGKELPAALSLLVMTEGETTTGVTRDGVEPPDVTDTHQRVIMEDSEEGDRLLGELEAVGVLKAVAELARSALSEDRQADFDTSFHDNRPSSSILLRYPAGVRAGITPHIDEAAVTVVLKISAEEETAGSALTMESRPVPLRQGHMLAFSGLEHFVPSVVRPEDRVVINFAFDLD